MEITELRREEENAWDAYIHKSSSSTFYHQLRSVLKLFLKFDAEEMWWRGHTSIFI